MATSSFTQDELYVASILDEVCSLILNAEKWPARIEKVRWGARRRRTEPPFKLDPAVSDAPPLPVEVEQLKKKEENASPSTPLSFPNSGGEEPILAPTAKRGKKPTRHKEWVKDKKEMVAALSDRNSDLLREIGEVKEKFFKLQALNSFLREQKKPKLNTQTQEISLRENLQAGPSTSHVATDATWTAPQPVVLGIERRIFNFDLNQSPSDDVAEETTAKQLTWQSEMTEAKKTAKELRRERMEKQREKYRARISKISSPSQSMAKKRPRVRSS